MSLTSLNNYVSEIIILLDKYESWGPTRYSFLFKILPSLSNTGIWPMIRTFYLPSIISSSTSATRTLLSFVEFTPDFMPFRKVCHSQGSIPLTTGSGSSQLSGEMWIHHLRCASQNPLWYLSAEVNWKIDLFPMAY